MSGTADDNANKWRGIVFFNPPKLLPRIPHREAQAEDRFILDFRSERDREAYVKACRVQVVGNCGAGARRSCALRATEKCHPTFWGSVQALFRWRKAPTVEEIEDCEAKELHACVVASLEHCEEYASDFCARVSRPPEQTGVEQTKKCKTSTERK